MIWLKTTKELLPTKVSDSGTFVKGACSTYPAPRALKGDLCRGGSNHKLNPTPRPPYRSVKEVKMRSGFSTIKS